MDTEIRWHLAKGSRGDGASVSSVVAETVKNDAQAHTHISSSRTGAGWERHQTETHLQNLACHEGTDYGTAGVEGGRTPEQRKTWGKKQGK